jgi:tetratricopeptide (TPR) repeat protein
MSEKKEVQEPERTDAVHRASSFWEKFQKPIIAAAIAVIVIAGAWLAYKKFYKEPAEERATDAIFKAEEYFRNDSLKLALNGDGQNKGLLYVISNFGGTKAENLAHYYAGVSYLKLGDFKNAVKHLEDFSTDAKQVQMLAYGCLADAYSELGKKEDAVKYYEKAGRYFEEDEFNSSEYLFRAGYLLESMGKNTEAVTIYKELKEKFPKTEKGFSADKFIYRLSIEKNEFSTK